MHTTDSTSNPHQDELDRQNREGAQSPVEQNPRKRVSPPVVIPGNDPLDTKEPLQ